MQENGPLLALRSAWDGDASQMRVIRNTNTNVGICPVEAIGSEENPEKLRLFFGHSQWTAGQLEDEIGRVLLLV